MVATTTQDLWDEFHDRLRQFVARRVDNPADVDDILQEIFLRLHQKLHTVEQPDRVHAWVYQITRNIITDYYRAPARRREQLLSPDAELELAQDDELVDLDLRHEIAACLTPMLERLSQEQRDALIIADVDGISQREAAAQMGISHSGMKSRVQRGRRHLKGLLLECCQVELDRRGGVVDYAAHHPGCTCCESCAAS